MGFISPPQPVLLLIAASSCSDDVLAWGRVRSEQRWGPVAAVSDVFDFTETDYYAAEMGSELKKQFWAFAQLVDPGVLAGVKQLTNRWESECAEAGDDDPRRPLNLDPGYLSLAKLVLASTKDHAHRIYLADGIYAEVTLSYRGRVWEPFPWTYPDYRRDDYQQFFSSCRDLLRGRVN